jgi:hypothetical protein
VNATILGGTTMSAHVADYSTLGSGDLPSFELGKPLDRLDVADLESEAAHGYELFFATQQDCNVFERATRADGGRARRTLDRFQLELVANGILTARIVADELLTLQVRVDGKPVDPLVMKGIESWDEVSLTRPADVASGKHRVEIVAPKGKSFAALSYWSFAPRNMATTRAP